MKKVILFFGLLTFLFSCTDNGSDVYKEVTIEGVDFTTRKCGGGYYLRIKDELYRAIEVVPNKILNKNTKFPKTYWIKYERPNKECYNMEDGTQKIKITGIKLKK
jgi:hypothetical protein